MTYEDKLSDPGDDDSNTVAQLPTLPCQRCFAGVMALPHSICAQCVEAKRLAKVVGKR